MTTFLCRATVNTRDNIPVMLPDTHNHQNQQIKLKLDSTLQSRKKRYKEDTTPISTIYDQEVNKLRKQFSPRYWERPICSIDLGQ